MDPLLDAQFLPSGFHYSGFYKRLIALNLTNLEPWRILQGQMLIQRTVGLRERYPSRLLVPFARRIDSDAVACWDLDADCDAISVIHDFANSGWE